MSVALLDQNGFDRRPHNIAPDAWYYEERKGLAVYHDGKLICVIPWRSVDASLKRYMKSKGKRK